MPLSSVTKPTAIVFATTFICSLLLGTALPITQARADHKVYGQNSYGKYHKGKIHHGYKYQNRKYKRQKTHRHNYRRNYRYNYNNNGDILAAGIIGLAIGAIISDSARIRRQRADNLYYELPNYAPPQIVNTYEDPYYRDPGYLYEDPNYPNYNQRRYNGTVYNNPPAPLPRQNPAQNGPKVITYEEAMAGNVLADPWTPEWFSYCRAKFRSFSETSGTYLGYDGKRHFCTPK